MILVLLLALILALEARHVDVETAFLNSWLRGVVGVFAEEGHLWSKAGGKDLVSDFACALGRDRISTLCT
ncbi:hypothetical protein PHMEG_00033421 [Phytophthora megakarya]|uniref:Uncharacterized protein n=1 Tax=Phytophthora megakarya TaxID=4795 RepID=A0A225UT50_9STRA|nr:hypothetical protein PHMEG_00033421 [Phytophthora megakarya]